MTLLRADTDAIHARRIVVDRLRRAAHDPAFHQRTVQRQRMEPVRTGLLAWNLPVARQHETLRRPKHLKAIVAAAERSEENTSELQSLMRNSYAVFSLQKKKKLTDRNK